MTTTRLSRTWGGRGLAASLMVLGASSAGAQDPTAAATVVGQSEVLAERAGIGLGMSRALVREIRGYENAIPAIVDVVMRPATDEGRVALIAYKVAANEECVRDIGPETDAEVRAARRSCRNVRDINSVVVAIHCTVARPGADACGETRVLWMTRLGARGYTDLPRYRETLRRIHITERNLDADPENEIIIDYTQDAYFFDPDDPRSNSDGEVSEYTRDATLVDANGAVLVRSVVSRDGHGQEDWNIHVRILEEGVQFAATECEAGTEGCGIPWGRPNPILRRPIMLPWY